jgi:hypothetical protein
LSGTVKRVYLRHMVFTVDCRAGLTVHRWGCPHLRRVEQADRYDFEALGADHGEIGRAALLAYNGGDDTKGVAFAFAPCV